MAGSAFSHPSVRVEDRRCSNAFQGMAIAVVPSLAMWGAIAMWFLN